MINEVVWWLNNNGSALRMIFTLVNAAATPTDCPLKVLPMACSPQDVSPVLELEGFLFAMVSEYAE